MLKSIRVSFCITAILLVMHQLQAQKEMDLYKVIPNAIETPDSVVVKDGVYSKVSRPSLTAYLPDAATATGAAVIICPGGGYSVLVLQKEGTNICVILSTTRCSCVCIKISFAQHRYHER